MQLYWSFLLIYLFRLTKSHKNTPSLLLNGHYVLWPSGKMEETFANDKRFIPKNIIYTRFQMSSTSNRVFLVAPRYRRGVPFTLGYVVITNKDKCFNYVKPFPCMEKQDTGLGACDSGSLVNAIDLVTGQDGVIWALDIGISDTLSEHPTRDGEPKVVGFDGSTGKIKHIISLRTLAIRSQSRLQYLVVENVNDTKTVLYVGDGGTRSILVWHVQKNGGYRVKLPSSTVRGCTDNPQNNVFYMALAIQPLGNYIYFTYLYSQDIFRARTKDLRERLNPKCIVNMGYKPWQMVFLGVGYGSVLYFRINGQNDLYAWDTKQSFLEENFMMVRRSKDCRTITHVDVDNDGVLWVLESNIQDFIADHVGCFGPNMLLTPIHEAPVHLVLNENEVEKNEETTKPPK